MIDFVRGGVPTCRYCKHIPRTVRKHWIDSVRDCKGLVPWTGETTEFLRVHDGVARLVMQASPPSDGRRASCSDLPSRGTVASFQLAPQGASFFTQTCGYLAASTGELVSRDTSHGSSRDGEARARGSLLSFFPSSGVAVRPQWRTAAAKPTLLIFASPQRRLLRQGSRRRIRKGHGGRGETGQGNWRLGEKMPQLPLKSSRKVESSLGFLFWSFARHGSCCDALFQWDPCPSVDGR